MPRLGLPLAAEVGQIAMLHILGCGSITLVCVDGCYSLSELQDSLAHCIPSQLPLLLLKGPERAWRKQISRVLVGMLSTPLLSEPAGLAGLDDRHRGKLEASREWASFHC